MKNKKMTYVLGISVMIVWGLIIYRIIGAVNGNDDALPAPADHIVKEAYQDYALPKDTATLQLNYKDPFGLVLDKDEEVSDIKATHASPVVPVKPAVNWSFIKYGGFIKNPGSKRLIAILSINGRNVMLAEGETSDNVKLLKNLKDSIKVVFDGQTKFITLNTGNL